MCFGGGGRRSSAANDRAERQQREIAEQQRRDAEAARQRAEAEAARRRANIETGMGNIDRAFSGFNDNYYNQVGTDYRNYYLPQVNKQAEEARRQMLFNASRAGTRSSSEYNRQLADLDENVRLRTNEIDSGANARINEARADIARQRSNQVSSLNASQGELAANSPFLTGQVSATAPTLAAFSPLGDLFSGLVGVLSNDTYIRNLRGEEGLLQSGARRLLNPVTGKSQYVEQ